MVVLTLDKSITYRQLYGCRLLLALLSAVTIKMKPPFVSRIFSMIGFITIFFTIISIKIDQKNSYIVIVVTVSGVLI